MSSWEVLPVAALLPDGLREDLRRADLEVAGRVDLAPDALLDGAIERPPPRVPEDAPGRLLLEVEQIHSLSERTVIDFVQHVQCSLGWGLAAER
jgi:hypothetical protein